MLYLIGSLKNAEIPQIAEQLRKAGHTIFDDWHAAGPEADDEWRRYELERGRTYQEALVGWAAKHVFEFDYRHLTRADGAILVLPAGKSAHLEFGWCIGKGKAGYVLMDNPDRWDVMYQFARGIYFNMEELITGLGQYNL
jgi:hypothetical protein